MASQIPWRDVREMISDYERTIAELKLKNNMLKTQNEKLKRKLHGKGKE